MEVFSASTLQNEPAPTTLATSRQLLTHVFTKIIPDPSFVKDIVVLFEKQNIDVLKEDIFSKPNGQNLQADQKLFEYVSVKKICDVLKEKSTDKNKAITFVDTIQHFILHKMPKAQNALGIYYGTGTGVKKDLNEAVKWYTRAANQNHSDAQNALGICYGTGAGVKQDMQKAVDWLTKAANQNHPDAQFNLALCYYNGTGVEKNLKEAVDWFTKAANQNQPDAQNALGVCYRTGTGVKQDMEKAVDWYTLAANQNQPDAQFNLAVCYYNGTGVEKNLKEAVRLYTLAANQNQPNAQFNLAVCYYNGTGVKQDMEKAVDWYTKAANQNQPDAQNALGGCYRTGTGVKKDLNEAVKWYTRAANQNHPNAQFNLGVCYRTGTGVKQDMEKAVDWFTKAANQNQPDAQHTLGIYYGTGTGVKQDMEKAVDWYTKAAEQNYLPAIIALAELNKAKIPENVSLIDQAIQNLQKEEQPPIPSAASAIQPQPKAPVKQKKEIAEKYVKAAPQADQRITQLGVRFINKRLEKDFNSSDMPLQNKIISLFEMIQKNGIGKTAETTARHFVRHKNREYCVFDLTNKDRLVFLKEDDVCTILFFEGHYRHDNLMDTIKTFS